MYTLYSSLQAKYFLIDHYKCHLFFSIKVLYFFVQKTEELVRFSLSPYFLSAGYISYFLSFVFFVGVLFSLCMRKKSEIRFFYASFFLVSFFVMCLCNALSIYPYGLLRYNNSVYFTVVLLFLFGIEYILFFLKKIAFLHRKF